MISSINSDLNSIVQWGIETSLEFNALMLSLKRDIPPLPLSMSGACIEEAYHLAILGMCIKNHLLLIDRSRSFFLRRYKKVFTPSDLAIIYKSYIRPKLEYNSHL